ncbi:Lhr family helicase [Dermatobacter hominis]|uniref:Lhr family helicase n=1 Tax=Dermatobacter hominis TaxID=2884263 RepID=UPI001D12B99C|nr:DEAD/DEAH box helicase [Dermatobacter hominis]UDY34626.1 DEAD/DEAH box helicase [Dermatobacter hominis]
MVDQVAPADPLAPEPLEGLSEPVRAWFAASFPEPTDAQARAWPAIAAGEHTLLCAPTGSGKTLAAFLWALDDLGRTPSPNAGVRVVYVSPLRALAVDVDKNLRGPLRGISLAAQRLGVPFAEPTIGVRTGDSSAQERRRLVRQPPDILITTPESLYLMLTSQARDTLVGVERVIVDEIHALAATKRGAHLALTLERLEHHTRASGREPDPVRGSVVQRIGLSATQRPLEVVAGYLTGNEIEAAGTGPGDDARVVPRPVRIVDAGIRKELDLQVVVPVDDMGALGEVAQGPDPAVQGGPAAAGPPRRSIWPSIHPVLLELVEQHRSTLVFVNARRLAERLASRLNELAAEEPDGDGTDGTEGSDGAPPADGGVPAGGPARRAAPAFTGDEASGLSAADSGLELVKAHHGSLSRERRLQIEDELKRGDLRGLVATSSLELGIDMGAVDLVVQVSSPGSVSAGLQRIGRAGHQVGAPSRGRIFPKHRADLLEAAVVVQRMKEGLIEPTSVPANPLDVLAQQMVAACALDEWPVDDLYALCRGAANFTGLSREVFEATLDMLAGRYPSEEFAELRPRVVWDRQSGVVRGRSGAQRLAVTSGGTIPDRGLYGVFLPDGTRVGELDEEMVYESRAGETFLLGASTWRIEEITFERVIVTPAPGQPGKMPFWHGDGPGRSAELGRALGEFVREVRGLPPSAALDRLREDHALDERAAQNVVGYLDEQAEATGVVPDDRTIVVERFRDEIGDWRLCLHSPFGARVHAPWATVIRARLEQHFAEQVGDGMGVEVLWSDDGIVIRLPESAEDVPTDLLFGDPEQVDAEVVATLPGTSAFAARFRESAARALLLPRRRPDRRTPLWQQRQRAADLLTVASKYPGFPILLEATRECCNDVFDLPALRRVLTEVRSRRIRVVPVETQQASPFARSLLFGWIAVYMYEGDAPLAERRAAALALDRELLRDLLGTEELRSLLDADVVAQVELELQRLTPERAARDVDEVHDLLRVLGPLSPLEISARVRDDVVDRVPDWIQELVETRRAIRVGMGATGGTGPGGEAEQRVAAAEDAARLRDGLGVAIPVGLPTAFTDPVDTPVRDLVERFARTHAPFTTAQVAGRLALSSEVVRAVLGELVRDGRVAEGDFTPGGTEREWCDADVLRQLRRRSLAALREEIAPVESPALVRFLPRWQSVGSRRRGPDALAEAVSLLQGAALPASALEADVLSIRVGDYSAGDLDMLCASGELVWAGAGALGAHDGRVRLVWRDQAPLLLADPVDPEEAGTDDPHHHALRHHLAARGASFWSDLVAAVADRDLPYDDETVLAALWDLVWAGEVTNDTFGALRAKVAGGTSRRASGARSRRPGPNLRRLNRLGPPAAAGRWSLTAPLRAPVPTPTEATTARAFQLLDRYGVLTREMALAEGQAGGFAGVYPVLKLLEERGQVRRGYFVAGLGAAQFASPGAVDRLRAAGQDDVGSVPDGFDDDGADIGARTPFVPDPDRYEAELEGDEPDAWVLAAVDPAQPFGAAIPWPETSGHPARAVGAYVVLVEGEACAYVEKGGRSLLTFPAAEEHPEWVATLATLVQGGRVRRLRIEQVDGASAASSPWASALLGAGFVEGYKGLTLGR